MLLERESMNLYLLPNSSNASISVALKDQNVLQGMHNNSLKQSVQMFQIQSTTGIKYRIDVQDRDKLPLYLQDDLQREQNFK
jgi:hypothetical protein